MGRRIGFTVRMVVAGVVVSALGVGSASAATAHALMEPAWGAASQGVATLLTSDSPADVAMALRVVQTIGGDGFEDALLAVSKGAETELATVALGLLAQTSDPRALAQLEAALASGEPALVSVAAVWLPAFGASGLTVAKRLLQSPDPAVRHAVVGALSQFAPSKEVRGVLADAGRHGDAQTARMAKRVLMASL